ncbi:MAG: UPF0164 family protein [Spirochaetota bacterium]
MNVKRALIRAGLAIGLLVFIAPSLVGNDVRFKSMGGAFTAVADDASAIRMNPAGLAHITEEKLLFFTGLYAHPAFSIAGAEPPVLAELGGVSPYELYYENNAIYYDGSPTVPAGDNKDKTFNSVLDSIGFDVDDPLVIDEVRSWYDAVAFFNLLHDEVNYLQFVPSFSYVTPGFGLHYEKNVTVEGNPQEGETEDERLLRFTREELLAAGTGWSYAEGLFSLGVSGSYERTARRTLAVPEFGAYDEYCDELMETYETDDPDKLGQHLTTGEFFRGVPKKHALSISSGALLSLGGLSLGSSFNLPITREAFSALSTVGRSFSYAKERINIGAALTTGSREEREILEFILAADLHRLGDEQLRTFHAGAELALNITKHAQATLRGGYEQPVPGELSQYFERNMYGWFDPDSGRASIGAGLRLFTAQLDAAVTMPAVLAHRILHSWVGGSSLQSEDVQGLSPEEGPRVIISGSMVF